ncbi:MAG: aminotransferase class III-fold pyridoxal phosphate-dependent enzyme [Gemmatimonadetes bacterium]|nr:aminotransferase class III-fold pyridoxal phosphate-dependent enzyme [Gemmatimonadota bacterium]
MIPGFSSTGSKRPEALFGGLPGVPLRMSRSRGCRLWDDEDREYLDTIMALGAVALGYAHPAVVEAAEGAMRDGAVGSLAPVEEAKLAERLAAVLPGVESSRFLKTGAEAVAAAVRIARVHTGREHVLTCGYHGWLDWCQGGEGVPRALLELRREIPFNDIAALERAVRESPPLAAIVVEPVVDAAPDLKWLESLKRSAQGAGAVLIFDAIKTAFRLRPFAVTPDLVVTGKALGNGFPIAAVSGPRSLLEAASRTWISSTLATEFVSLRAALAVMDIFQEEKAQEQIANAGARFHSGLGALAAAHPRLVSGVRGVPEMCYLAFPDDAVSVAVAARAAQHGLLFKRSAYNFVSLAHDDRDIDTALERLAHALDDVEKAC